jgi:hypothetical protein
MFVVLRAQRSVFGQMTSSVSIKALLVPDDDDVQQLDAPGFPRRCRDAHPGAEPAILPAHLRAITAMDVGDGVVAILVWSKSELAEVVIGADE